MDLSYSAADEAFRAELREWLAANLPAEWRYMPIGARPENYVDIRRQWQRRLYDGGWLKLHWPRSAGGREASPVMGAIYGEEMALAQPPSILGYLGVNLLAPALLRFGSDWQREQYVEKILSGELVFCQGFSEPNAGSDLAGLRSRAERVDGGWRVSGQKVWSSEAHLADHSFFLARTAFDTSKPHRDILFLLLDLRQQGVDVRPIRQMSGSAEFCEIFVTDAFVPDGDVVPGDGWKTAMATFGFERGGLANASRFEKVVAGMVELARRCGSEGDRLFRQRIAQGYIEARILGFSDLRALTRAQRGAAPGPEMSIRKLYWSELDKRLQETAIDLQGLAGALDPQSPSVLDGGHWQLDWMWAQAETILAGTSEIQRNIIAERVLGLPRGR